jgi:hypothetical protein
MEESSHLFFLASKFEHADMLNLPEMLQTKAHKEGDTMENHR